MIGRFFLLFSLLCCVGLTAAHAKMLRFENVSALRSFYEGRKSDRTDYLIDHYAKTYDSLEIYSLLRDDAMLRVAFVDLPTNEKEAREQIAVFGSMIDNLRAEAKIAKEGNGAYRNKSSRSMAEIHEDIVTVVRLLMLQAMVTKPSSVNSKSIKKIAGFGPVFSSVAVGLSIFLNMPEIGLTGTALAMGSSSFAAFVGLKGKPEKRQKKIMSEFAWALLGIDHLPKEVYRRLETSGLDRSAKAIICDIILTYPEAVPAKASLPKKRVAEDIIEVPKIRVETRELEMSSQEPPQVELKRKRR